MCIAVARSDRTLLTNSISEAIYRAKNCRSFKYFYFPQIEFTQPSEVESDVIVKRLKGRIPYDFKEVADKSLLKPNTYYVEVRHPSRPLLEEDMSCISFIFGKENINGPSTGSTT